MTEEYKEMGPDQVSIGTNWTRFAEMQDIKPIAIYSLRSGEHRTVVLTGFDIETVLSAHQPGGSGNLWPWFLRLTIHIQDLTGRQVASSEKIVSVWLDTITK